MTQFNLSLALPLFLSILMGNFAFAATQDSPTETTNSTIAQAPKKKTKAPYTRKSSTPKKEILTSGPKPTAPSNEVAPSEVSAPEVPAREIPSTKVENQNSLPKMQTATIPDPGKETQETDATKSKTLDDILVTPTPSQADTTVPTSNDGRSGQNQNPSISTQPSIEASKTPTVKSETVEPSSTYERAKTNYSLGAEVGFPVFPIPAVGVNFGYYLNSKTLIQAEMTQGALSWYFISVKATTAGVHVKRFLGNSFYGKLGADYRRIDLGHPTIPGVGDLMPDTGRAESILATFALGNQWHWDSYTVGVDWAGIMIPITPIRQDLNRSGFNGADLGIIDQIWDRVAKSWSVEVLRVSISATF